MRWPAGLVLLAFLAAPREPGLRFEAVEPHMGTLVRITVYTPDQEAARAAFRGGFDRIRQLDEILSDYRPDSELNRIARTAVGRPVRVSEDLFAVLHAGQVLAAATGGAFDVTQGPVVRLWREARRTRRLPDQARLRDAQARTGFSKLRLDPHRGTVRLEQPGMALDVGALGKGYAASEVLEVLRSRGITSALVAVSGDLAFSDPPPGKAGWRIRLHGGGPGLDLVPDVLDLANAAVSTSGSSAQHLDLDGRRYSHIIDPSSRTGLTDDLQVSVVAPNGLEADGLSTAISLLGEEKGLQLVESYPEAAALLIRRTGETAVGRMSPGFERLVARQGPS